MNSTTSVAGLPNPEAEIQRIIEQLDVAWNSHDAKAYADLFAVDADFTNVRGMQAQGREGVEAFMAPLFDTMFSDSEQRLLKSRARVLSDVLAAVDCWWTMDGARTLDGYPRPTRYGLTNLLMRKDPEGWRILVWHNMELVGPPPKDPRSWRFVIFHNEGQIEGNVGRAKSA